MRFLASITPVAWVTMALVVLLEAAFFAFTDPLTGMPLLAPTSDDATVVAKRAMIRRSDGAIVLIGDSSCMFGLVPEVIRDATGTPVLNLGTLLSFTLAGYAALAEEMLREHRPAGIVVAVHPRAFAPDGKEAEHFGQVGRYLLAYGGESGYSPTFQDLSRWIFRKHQINSFPSEFGGSYASFVRRLDSTQGFFPEFHEYAPGKRREDPFSASRLARESLARLAEAAARKNVPVYFWWSPVPTDAVDSTHASAVAAFTKELRSIPNLTVIPDSLPTWDPGLFATITHVNARGAAINSQNLGRSLAGENFVQQALKNRITAP